MTELGKVDLNNRHVIFHVRIMQNKLLGTKGKPNRWIGLKIEYVPIFRSFCSKLFRQFDGLLEYITDIHICS